MSSLTQKKTKTVAREQVYYNQSAMLYTEKKTKTWCILQHILCYQFICEKYMNVMLPHILPDKITEAA